MNSHLSQKSSPSVAITLCVLGRTKLSKTQLPLPRPHPRRKRECSPRYPCEEDTRLVLSLIAIYNSWNALWTLYAGGVLWARNVRQKAQWTLCALWEKNLSTTLKCFLFLTEEHRRKEHTKAHKDSGHSPDHSPGGKGSDHRDTPIRRISPLCCPLLVSTIVLTLCDICMPEAFCGIETVRKWVLLNLWALWEKEMSFLKDKNPQWVACV